MPSQCCLPISQCNIKKRGSLYRAQERASKKNTFETLKEIIGNSNASFPIIGVHSDYHKEQGILIEGRDYDHVLVVLSIENDNIWFHDPYRPYAEKSSLVERFNNSVPLVRMLKYWDEAWDTRWLMWIDKPRGPLDKFGVLSSDKKR